jgi:hypothetical protein
MPQYRKLYTKTTESLDVNDMPDDFTRLTWVLLPLALCREGRGLDNAAWIKAKIYPLRMDVTLEQIQAAVDWYADRGMIRRYSVSGRGYFFVPTWYEYQTGTNKEAPSPYPQPDIDLLQDNSRQTPDKLQTKVIEYEYESAYESNDLNGGDGNNDVTPFQEISAAVVEYTGIRELTGGAPKWVESIRELVEIGATPELIHDAVKLLRNKRYAITGPWSLRNTIVTLAGEQRGLQPEPIAKGYSHA